ncbi:hypothetical protein FNV43_RR27317 [Rhamnella rubrinervis]|uniref:Uncharacterized protein n=1 Tax=Rhamnella rubrinervis TaxID=2594499 RepID=A0A8K0DWN7_9ROSA|nr:hypothetical protein FNV43_RR27317 [Rhamnella rubrinervis]
MLNVEAKTSCSPEPSHYWIGSALTDQSSEFNRSSTLGLDGQARSSTLGLLGQSDENFVHTISPPVTEPMVLAKWLDILFTCSPVSSNFKALNLSTRLSTNNEQNNRIDILCGIREKSLNFLLSEESFSFARYWPPKQDNPGTSPLDLKTDSIPEGITLHILEVPYTRVLEGCIRFLYGKPSYFLWTSYPAIDMRKLKVRKLAKKERRKREKKAAQKLVQDYRFETGEINRPTPEPSEDEGEEVSSEISSEKNKSEKNAKAKKTPPKLEIPSSKRWIKPKW